MTPRKTAKPDPAPDGVLDDPASDYAQPRDTSTAGAHDEQWSDWADWEDAPLDGPGALGELGDDPRVRAGVEHLQQAAQEMIAASRALLDVAEDVVNSPAGAGRLLGLFGELGAIASRLGMVSPAPQAHDDDDPEPPIQRIPVS